MGQLTPAQRQEEARVLEFSTLVDSVKDYAIFMLDPEGRVVTWNAGARRLKGYADHEVIGQHFSMFFPEGDIKLGRPQELLARAAEQPVEAQGWRVAKGGRRFWADAILSPVHDDDGELMGFIKVTRDLTDRRRAEDAIRDSEERLRLMID